uniref:C-type lectin domain-containing protein n=1 Tax=Branchiostoma floridae TaxID=7739 RepID=C3ZT64_BRAFL|eukprot:XP_002588259.1 hypothetical protein BRAFLDRAFT_86707 [Branchiostoma floridae]
MDSCAVSVSVGRAGIWIVDYEGEVYHRVGTFFNETSRGEAWVHVPGVTLQQVAVGDGVVWGVESSHRAYVKVLPRSVNGEVCQVGLKGRSMCNAVQREKRLCAEDEIICPHSDNCIPECSVCDEVVDCGDGDDNDERNCWIAACPEKHRRMCDGELGCYSPSRVCDGEWNCGESKVDKWNCLDSCSNFYHRYETLKRALIQCRDLEGCVHMLNVCDGGLDCSDGSDETGCEQFCSLHGLFGDIAYWKCRNSPGCVKGEFLCNGIADCADGSDEENCDFCGPHAISAFDVVDLNFETGLPTDGTGMQHAFCIPSENICNGLIEGTHDEMDCTQGLPYPCFGTHDWQCPGENTCLSGDKSVCNTLIQCANGEDEKHCEGYCNDIGGFFCGDTNECKEQHRVCDGHPDCSFYRYGGYIPPPDELSCGIGACFVPVPLLLEGYSIDEGIGSTSSYLSRRNRGLFLTHWVVEGDDDWLQITLASPIQLAGVVVSGVKSAHTHTFALEYGLGTACMTAYTEGDERKKMVDFTWSDGSPVGNAFREQNISYTGFREYIWRLNDPFCAFLERHVCDDCMASKTSCGYVRCGIPDQYRCGLIYSPGYPHAFPSSVICLWTIDGPPGSYVTLLLLDVDLPGYSGGACTSRVLQVRDRFLTVEWHTIHGLCRGEVEQKRFVSSSNEMRLAMLATSHEADFGESRGFMATFNISTFRASRRVDSLPDDAGYICPCGWHLFRRNCYQTFQENVPVNWWESDVICRQYGANLTSIADLQEMEFLHLLVVTNVVVKRIADPKLFIGLYDISRDRTFVWTDGIPVTFTDWSPMDLRTGHPQPDGAKINFCVAIVMKNVWGTDQWYDVACDDRDTRSFICKRAAERVTLVV